MSQKLTGLKHYMGDLLKLKERLPHGTAQEQFIYDYVASALLSLSYADEMLSQQPVILKESA